MTDFDTRYEVSPAKVKAFRDEGWVHLPGLLNEDVAKQIYNRLTTHFAAERPKIAAGDQKWLAEDDYARVLSIQEGFCRTDEFFRSIAISQRVAGTALQLIGEPQARFFSDSAFVKMGQGGLATPMHQDYPFWPMDRAGTFTIWIALVDMTPDMGSLTFLSGSHREGSLGRFNYDAQDDARRTHPWLEKKYTLVSGHTMKPGDATVHLDLTVHGAGPNLTPKDRAAYSLRYSPRDVRYTGAPHRLFDKLGIKPDERIGDAFQLIDANAWAVTGAMAGA